MTTSPMHSFSAKTPPVFHATFLGSTLEPGEPMPITNPVSSIWWTFTPSETRAYSIFAYIDQVFPDPVVKAYRGDQLTNLIPLQNHAPVTPQYQSHFTFRATAGETIRVQVLHSSPAAKAVVVSARSGPQNDDFQNALQITNSVIKGTTQGASSEFGEGFTQTVWYEWQPDKTRAYELLFIAGYAHSLFIFEGDSLSNLKLLAHTNNESFAATLLGDVAKSYYIAISGGTVFSGPFEFRINSGPDNDMFTYRTVIPNLDEYVSGDLSLATREPDEPSHTNNPSRTVWYQWAAPATGGHYIELTGPSALVNIYTGNSLTNLTAVPTSLVQQGSTTNSTTFRAVQGESYVFAISDQLPSAFSFRVRPGPPNDDFANASIIILDSQIDASLVGASREPGEPLVLTGIQTVWHRFVAPASGTYIAFTKYAFGVPAVFRGSSLSDLVLAKPSFTNLSFRFPFSATNGETVFISVAAQHSYNYSLVVREGPQNDSFNDRLPIDSRSVITNSAGATIEPGEPIHSTNFTGGSLWWIWTPTTTGMHRIQALVPNERASIAVYTGAALTNLTLVTSPGFQSFYPSSVLLDLHVQSGIEYIIAVTYLPSDDSPLVLEIRTPPAHDSFSAALPLTLNEPITNVFIVSTREPDESTNSYRGSLWYSWTAPETGPYNFLVHSQPLNFGTYPLVFTGSALTNLTRVPSFHYSSNETHTAAFYAQQGITYRFSVETHPLPLELTFTTAILPGRPNDDFADAALLSGTFVAWRNSLFGATCEPGEELVAPRPSIWFRWTAPESGGFKIVLPSSYRAGAYHGTSLNDLRTVALTRGTNTTLSFAAEAGTTYNFRISLAGSSGDSSFFNLRLGPAAPNETISTATELIGNNISIVGHNWTTLTGNDLGSRLIWYKWTAPSHGLITFGSATNVSISAYHTRVPTLNSNLIASGFTQGAPNSGTNGVAVTSGVAYLFSLRTAASTNIPFNLQFTPQPVSLGALSGALLGGDALWTVQSNVVFSPPDALVVGLHANRSAFIEFVIYGRGTLSFRTQINSLYGSITLARTGATATQYRGSHYWTPRTVELTRSDYNIVRITMTGAGPSTENPMAWLDDIQFTSQPPLRPSLGIVALPGELHRLSLPIQAGRLTTIETSTNLADWLPWTNILSAVSGYQQFSQPTASNSISQFFRARITP